MANYHRTALTLLFSAVALATASACEDDHWIKSITLDGAVVILEDGSVWEVDSLDQIDSQLWLSTENIVACDDKLINTDEDQAVGATKIN
jgi:hypothetical protein